MNAVSNYRSFALSWGNTAAVDDLLFKKILRISLVVMVLLSLVFSILPAPKKTIDDIPEVPQRLARLVLQPKPPPPPPPKLKPVKKVAPKPVEPPKPKPVVKPKPKPVPKPAPVAKKPEPPKVAPAPSARDVAKQSGLLAFKDDLADLRSNSVTSSLNRTTLKSGDTQSTATKTSRSIITANSTRGSGGIQTAAVSRNAGGSGLAGRATTQVSSPVGNGGGGGGGTASQRTGGSGGASRTIEDIQIVFDQNKGRIYGIYNRALRRNPTLQGKVVLKLTIQPSGKVSDCQVVSSELNDSDLESKLVRRIKLIDFGAKDVAVMTVTYPIDFLPS